MNADDPIMQRAYRACAAGMKVVHHYQRHPHLSLAVKEKEDMTLLTATDIESQAAIRRIFLDRDIAFWGEEGGQKGFVGGGRYGAIVDPLDGTNPFVSGLWTSTVIVGIYDRETRRTVGCVIGEASSGRISAAVDGRGEPSQTEHRVWNGPFKNGNVLMDSSCGFKSRGRQILTDRGNAALYGALNGTCRILMPGSNGLMQMLVANGRERMVGSITTAVGFPGDVCGALLVHRAGGALKAYARTDDGELQETDSLDPLSIDALICANNQETLRFLASAFEEAAQIK